MPMGLQQEQPKQLPVQEDWGIIGEHDGQPKEKFEEIRIGRT
jgi:hypothetical protein